MRFADRQRLDVMQRANDAALSYDERIKMAMINYYDEVRALWRESEDLHDVIPALLFAGGHYANADLLFSSRTYNLAGIGTYGQGIPGGSSATAVAPGHDPGPVVSHGFVFLHSSAANFDSDVPLIVLETYGGSLSDTLLRPATAVFIETGADRRAEGPADLRASLSAT